MRALVINPWIYDFAAYDLWSKPIGLFRLIHILELLGFEVDFIDCLDRFHPALSSVDKPKRYSTEYGDGKYLTEPVRKPALFSSIPRRFKRYGIPMEIFRKEVARLDNPDIIFINSGMTYWYPGPLEAIRIVKDHFNPPIVLGGVYVRLCPVHAEKNSGADLVFSGSTDLDVIDTVNSILKTDFNLPDVVGLNYYNTGYRYYTQLRYVTIRTSKGCPFRCSYCGWYNVDSSFVRCDPDEITKLILNFHAQGIRDFAFYDDALLYEPDEHFLRIFEPIGKETTSVRFHTPNGLHFRYVSREVAQTMKKANFIKPRFGLEDIRLKDRNIDDFCNTVNNLLDAGYAKSEIYANILVGLPGQTPDHVYRTIDAIGKLGVKIRLEEYSPVPGSEDFAKTSLSLSDDPLLHNNTAYLLMHPAFGKAIDRIKRKVREANHM